MSDPDLATKHFLIYGRVQKVGYRKWAVDRAEKAGLTGWVRNRPDGRVEILVTGSQTLLREFEDQLADGPAQAAVVRVVTRTAKPKVFKSFSSKPNGPKTAEAVDDIVTKLDPRYLAACQKAYSILSAPNRKPNSFASKERNWRFNQIDTAAAKHGIDLIHLGPNAPPSLLCRSGAHAFGLDATRPSWVSFLTEELSNNKYLTKIILEGAGVSVPRGEVCNSAEEARAAFNRIGGTVVVKPVFGTEAKGVTLNVSSERQCDVAYAQALAQDAKGLVLVEAYVPGVDLRILLLGQKIIAAYLRLPANVVGDGESTIADLVAEKNAARISLPSTQDSHLIKLGIKERRLLTLQGYDPDAVPGSGRVVLLGVSPNYIDGADLIHITDQVHPEVAKLAEDAVGVIDPTGFWGVDVLTENFDAPIAQSRTVICEVNSRPVGGVFRHATHGPHVPFFEEAFKCIAATPQPSLSGRAAHVDPSAAVSPVDVGSGFDRQVADILATKLAGTFSLTPKIIVRCQDQSTEFYDLNSNPSFIRGALAPWRWKAVRQHLERNGVRLTPHVSLPSGDEIQPGTSTPLGRAFLTRPRQKMKTVWIEGPEAVSRIVHARPDWACTIEYFATPSSAEVAFIAGRPVAMVRIDYHPILADGITASGTLLLAALKNSPRRLAVAQPEVRKLASRLRTVLPSGTAVPQPQLLARLSGSMSVCETIPQDLSSMSEDILDALPGLTLGTLVFRALEDGKWGLSEIRADADPVPFLTPDHGKALDLAQIQAGHVQANVRTFDVALAARLTAKT